jgi:hypothetical protein
VLLALLVLEALLELLLVVGALPESAEGEWI